MTFDTDFALGFDFGTESVRSAIVCTETGTLLGSAVSKYNSSQITASHQTNLGIKNMQPHMVLQNSNDWIESAKKACKQVVFETNILFKLGSEKVRLALPCALL